MPRRTGIQWTDKQLNQLRRDVKRFNAKISRAVKRTPEMADFLPPKLSVKELRQQIRTAGDLRLLSAAVDRAFKPGAFDPIVSKQGIRTTQWLKNEIRLGVRRINKARQKEREEGDPSAEKGNEGAIRDRGLSPKQFDFDKIKADDWDAYVRSVEKQAMDSYTLQRMEQYKENYIAGLKKVFGPMADELISQIEKLTPQQVYLGYYQDPILQLDFIYDEKELNLRFEVISELWADFMGRG